MAETRTVDPRDWKLLVLLSILWGGSFFFASVVMRELPPLTMVLARVGLAALALLLIHRIKFGDLPSSCALWGKIGVMACLNNVIPFTLLAFGQREIASGLAAVLNATAPLFTIIVMASFGVEKAVARKLWGLLIGIGGVALLSAETPLTFADAHVRGVALCLSAALSYGFAGLWARQHLHGIPPLTAATCQLLCSTAITSVLATVFERPWTLALPGSTTIWSLVGFAFLSTALAYIVFFQILTRSGASNVMLVTLLIPVTSLLLGCFVLGEAISTQEIAGTAVIAGSLLVVDGRLSSAVIKQMFVQRHGI